MKQTVIRTLFNIILIVTGISLAFLGLEGFLLPNHFIDGGITGLSMLMAEVSGIPLWILITAINAPFIILGASRLGVRFSLVSAAAIIGLALCLKLISIAPITGDKLLAAVFGGICLGSGIGLAARGSSALDGTELLAIILSKRISLSMGEVILIVNIIIFSIAIYFLDIERVLYSLLTYFTASKMIDFIVYGIEERVALMIVSTTPEKVKDEIISQMNLTVTLMKGRTGFTSKEKDILYCVVTKYELRKLQNMVLTIDPQAFVIVQKIVDTLNGRINSKAVI